MFWSPLTYSLLHSDWTHLIVNSAWMLAFGAAVARRFGAVRFLAFGCVCSLGGAALHYVFHVGDVAPVIGASAVVSGFMGAASRFAFGRSGLRQDLVLAPALSLVQTFSNRQVMMFLAIWFGLNFLFGSGLVPIAGEDQSIAWQAHIGGFAAGLLLFSFFDPAGKYSPHR